MKIIARYGFMVLLLMACAGGFLSCSSDDDDYAYATMTAELCDAYADSPKQLAYAIDDNGRRLEFTDPLSASWATKADSTYRTLLYYNKVENGNVVKPLGVERAYVLKPASVEKVKNWASTDDPLSLVAAWYAKSGNYLNLKLAVKTGAVDDDKQLQSIGLVCDTVMTSDSGKRYYYRICHNQNNIPTYYTVDTFASIPSKDISKGDTITLTVPTDVGVVSKDYIK